MSSKSHSSLVSQSLLLLIVPSALLLTGCGGPDLIERITRSRWDVWGTVIVVLDLVALFDLLSDEARGTVNKVLWALLIIFFPIGGVILYFVFGS